MRRAADLFSAQDRERVARAVQEAEAKTAAEIVPVVATASGRYDRPADMVGLWVGLLALAGTWLLWPRAVSEPGDWGGMPAIYEIVALLVSTVLGFLLGAAAATRLDGLRRLFTPQKQMRDQVQARASASFCDSRVHHTQAGTGLLIYVSLFEHLAVILGDRGIVDKLGQPALDELCRQLTGALGGGDVTGAICQTIQNAGDRLAPVLPRTEAGVNQLPDALVTID